LDFGKRGELILLVFSRGKLSGCERRESEERLRYFLSSVGCCSFCFGLVTRLRGFRFVSFRCCASSQLLASVAIWFFRSLLRSRSRPGELQNKRLTEGSQRELDFAGVVRFKHSTPSFFPLTFLELPVPSSLQFLTPILPTSFSPSASSTFPARWDHRLYDLPVLYPALPRFSFRDTR